MIFLVFVVFNKNCELTGEDVIHITKPGILFKYRKFDKNNLKLLLNRELWFAKPDTLNDPFEANSSFSNVLDAVWKHYPLPLDMRIKYERYLKQSLQQVGICSFSKARKNQLMWSHYADEHKGICIGFKEEYLKKAGVSFWKQMWNIRIIIPLMILLNVFIILRIMNALTSLIIFAGIFYFLF